MIIEQDTTREWGPMPEGYIMQAEVVTRRGRKQKLRRRFVAHACHPTKEYISPWYWKKVICYNAAHSHSKGE